MINYKKSVGGNINVPLTNMSGELDYAHSVGADCYNAEYQPHHIAEIKISAIDYYAQGIAKAHSLGMKFVFRIIPYMYDPALSYYNFIRSQTEQDAFVADMVWMLQRYPTVDGIELEEPMTALADTNTTTLSVTTTANNAFFLRCKNTVSQYHNLTDGTFAWGFNNSSNDPANVPRVGIDVVYLNSNQIFNMVAVQDAENTLANYQWVYGNWKNWFSNATVLCWTYEYAHGAWNPAFFDELKWAVSQNIPIDIFTLMRLKQFDDGTIYNVTTIWPNDTTPGATAGDKVLYIWGTAPIPPAPVLGSITLPGSFTLIQGTTRTFAVDCRDTTGTLLTCPVLSALSSNPSVATATMYSSGLLIAGVSQGTTTITVSSSGITSNALTITVSPAPCISTGYACELPLNGYEKDNCGNRRLNPACNPPPILNSLNITPALIQINQGQEITITIKAMDSSGVVIPGVPVVITSDPTGIITTNPTQGSTFTDGTLAVTVHGLVAGLTALKATSGSIVGTATVDVNNNPCISAWVCETPLNGYEKDGCGNRRLNPACNVPPPVDNTTTQVVFIAMAIGAALGKF